MPSHWLHQSPYPWTVGQALSPLGSSVYLSLKICYINSAVDQTTTTQQSILDVTLDRELVHSPSLPLFESALAGAGATALICCDPTCVCWCE